MSTKGGQKSGAEAKVSSGNGGKSSAPANAWARPLQSKRATAPPPGMGPPTKPTAASSQSSVLFQHRERLLHLSLTLVGQKVVLHQTNGAIVEGIFHTFTPFSSLPADQRNKYVLKEILIQQQPSTETAIKDGITLIIPASKVVLLHAVGIAAGLRDSNKINGSSNAGEAATSKGTFATDTQISGSGTGGKTNDLVAAGNAWTAAGNSNGNGNYRNQALGAGGLQPTNSRATALAGNSKGDSATNNQQGVGGSATAPVATGGKISGSIGQWDQFKANKELFNVNASFDENLYTTQLDTSQIDKKKIKEAERIAKEIENTMTKNIHMAEERGFKVETDFDEEDLYSGVLTKDGKQRHEKVTISKKSVKEKDTKNVGNSSKSNSSSSTSPAPRKIMNYAAAAAKADASKNKSAPPGFSSNGTPAPASTTKDSNDKEKKTAGSSTAVVTPEKNAKEDVKVTQKSVSSKESKSASKHVEEKTETIKQSEKDETSAAKDNEVSKDSSSTTPKPSGNESDKKVEAKDEATDQKAEKKDSKKLIKLNANAKSFTFNPSAKTFTPTFGSGASNNPPPQPPQQAATADPNMQMYGGGHPMQHSHYLQTGPMGQPGMMPIMNPQYSGMSYPSSYRMEQPMSQMQHQAPHVQAQATPSAPNSGNAPTPTPGSGPSNANDDDQGRQQREEDASQTGGQQQQPQRSQQQQSDQTVHSQGPPQQQQIPMSYNIPPNAYFQPGMGMPRPGYPQFVAGPQPGRPGVPPYGIYPMQPGGMPQNIQMRGPNATPYYPGPNGPMPYPPVAHMGYPMMDDGGRGRGGRSSNSGRGGRGRGGRSGRGGRGRSNYNNNNSNPNSGKNSQQHYNHHQSQQQQPSVPQQQGQPGNTSSNKSD